MLFEGGTSGRRRVASLSKASSEKGASWNVLVRVDCSSQDHHPIPSTLFLPLQRKGLQPQRGCVLGLVSFGPDTGPLGFAAKGLLLVLGCVPSVPG